MAIKKDLTNQIFGELTVLHETTKRASNGSIIWKCRCSCGREIEVVGSNLTRAKNSTKSCGKCTSPNSINLIGQTFNKLTVIEKTEQRINGKVVWKCLCACGNTHFVHTANLKNGSVKSCGKCFDGLTLKVRYPKKQLLTEKEIIGTVIGSYYIISNSGQKKNSYNLYQCECIHCKSQTLKTISELKALKGKYCKNCHEIDITNEKFGLLTVLEKTSNPKKWRCLCECGKIVEVFKYNLISGNSISCGCKHRSKGEIKIEEYLLNHDIMFENQKTFDNCCFEQTNQKARFDFYLPEYDLLIEYDGQQHYKEVSVFQSTLEEIQNRDNYKNKWCEDNDIHLLRIPYFEYDNIDDILNLVLLS